jgi:hypothetical protein
MYGRDYEDEKTMQDKIQGRTGVMCTGVMCTGVIYHAWGGGRA